METDDNWYLTSEETAKLAGITYRQLDYWARVGVIAPDQEADGSGSHRRWSPDKVQVLRLVAVLRELGAQHETIVEAVRQAEELADKAWAARVLVTRAGRITTLLGGDCNGYAVDLSLLRSTSVADSAERALAVA